MRIHGAKGNNESFERLVKRKKKQHQISNSPPVLSLKHGCCSYSHRSIGNGPILSSTVRGKSKQTARVTAKQETAQPLPRSLGGRRGPSQPRVP